MTRGVVCSSFGSCTWFSGWHGSSDVICLVAVEHVTILDRDTFFVERRISGWSWGPVALARRPAMECHGGLSLFSRPS